MDGAPFFEALQEDFNRLAGRVERKVVFAHGCRDLVRHIGNGLVEPSVFPERCECVTGSKRCSCCNQYKQNRRLPFSNGNSKAACAVNRQVDEITEAFASGRNFAITVAGRFG